MKVDLSGAVKMSLDKALAEARSLEADNKGMRPRLLMWQQPN